MSREAGAGGGGEGRLQSARQHEEFGLRVEGLRQVELSFAGLGARRDGGAQRLDLAHQIHGQHFASEQRRESDDVEVGVPLQDVEVDLVEGCLPGYATTSSRRLPRCGCGRAAAAVRRLR